MTETIVKESVNQKKLMNASVKVLNSEKFKDCPICVLRKTKVSTQRKLIKELKNQFGTTIPETTRLTIDCFKGSTKSPLERMLILLGNI